MPDRDERDFWPGAFLIKVDGEEEAIRAANDTEVWVKQCCVRNLDRSVAVVMRIEAGMT